MDYRDLSIDEAINDVKITQAVVAQVRLSGLKLLMGTAAAGSSPSSARAPARPAGNNRQSNNNNNGVLDAVAPTTSSHRGTSATVGITANSLDRPSQQLADGREGLIMGRRGLVAGGDDTVALNRGNGRHLAPTTAARGVLSPAVLSRARRVLVGVSNIDKNADARKLAGEALVALGMGS